MDTIKVGDRVVCGYAGRIRGTVLEIGPDPDYPTTPTAKVKEDNGEVTYWFVESIKKEK